MAERQLRLFFAIWPDASGAEQTFALAKLVAAQCGGRLVSPERIHLTLAFLGAVSPHMVGALRACITGFDVPRFCIAFDRIGVWRKTGIAWLAASQAPPALGELHRRIAAGLVDIVRLPDDHPFSPHVTLARRAERKPAISALERPIVWRIDAFSLVCSQPGPEGPTYERIAEWRLAPDTGGNTAAE